MKMTKTPTRNDLTGAIYVVDELDFETKQNYDLIIRATDSVSGVYAEVPLSIAVSGKSSEIQPSIYNEPSSNLSLFFSPSTPMANSLDVNDCPPTLSQANYDVKVSESAPFGSVVLKVTAQDNDGPGNLNSNFT
jgi:protocadherin Fat 1/2/3